MLNYSSIKAYCQSKLAGLTFALELSRRLTRCGSQIKGFAIARLLGHKRISSVKYYRKMSNRLLADESRRVREKQSKILLANIGGGGGRI